MTTYFHVTTANLRVGSIIERGNFGRLKRLSRNDGSSHGWAVATEIAFEAARLKDFSNLPSRLECSFAFLAHADAIRCRDRVCNPGALLYEVALADEGAVLHIGDFDLLTRCNTPNPAEGYMEMISLAATRYWQGRPGIQTPELLASSGLRVIRALDWTLLAPPANS